VRPALAPRFALVVAAGLGGCDLARDAAVDAGPDGPPPLDDHLVPAIGSATTLDLACWNTEFFPKSPYTVDLVADLIASLDLDLVVFEEIASVDAWDQLVARLPDRDAVLSTHRYTPTDYQKIGVIYRRGLVTVGPPELLFTGDGEAFPRPPLKVHVDAAGLSFDAIGVHLKAGTAPEDAARRAGAIQSLDAYLRDQIDGGGEDDVIVLGDFNEVLTSDAGLQVLAPLHAAPDRYRFLDEDAAVGGAVSFLPAGVMLDHMVVTAGLYPEVGSARATVPRLDQLVPAYDAHISDHLPVVVSIPQP
jgi:endonuclease/exonuclease/phosphatase family metal-dependent hydrolase